MQDHYLNVAGRRKSSGRATLNIKKVKIERPNPKKSGLKVVTLIATPNPVSQVLW
jgi:hypothetical protein